MALAGVAWLCWETVGRWTALLATITLALSPGFVIAAHAVEAEAPMMGFTSLSVAAAARYARTRNRLWLTLASLLLAAATLSKLLAVSAIGPLVVAIIFAVLAEKDKWRQRLLGDAVVALCCTGAPLLLALLLFSPAQQWDQVIRFHLQTAKIPNLADSSMQTYLTFLSWDPGLLALAVTGLAAVAVLRRPLCLLQCSWLLCTYLPIARYYPLFIHHLTVLLPPLAAVAGGVAAVLDYPRAPRRRRLPAALLLVVGLIAYVVWLPFTADHLATMFARDTDPLKAARVGWLKAHSGPGDMVVTDDQVLAVAADRLVPPALSDTSIVRWQAGYLPLSRLEQSTANSRVKAVLLMRQLMYIPPYVQWLKLHFHQVQTPQLGGALTFVR
jgi:4-amino-4-deoxy-L-arabinose transferase-like glycosyltransferase